MRPRLRSIVLILSLALLPAAGEAIFFRDNISWLRPPAADEVDAATASRWNALWLDARPGEDFERAHIPGALPLNAENWDELLPSVLKVWTPDRRLVVYCSAQSCDASKEVARRLREEAGLKNVFVLTGGWEGWRDAHR